MKKRKTYLVVLILIAIAVLFFVRYYEKEEEFMQIRFYDANKNLITIPYSVVNVPLASFIDITLTASNQGDYELSCVPTTISPLEFDSAMPKIAKFIPVGRKVSWTSNLIDMSVFKDNPNQRFNATLKCSYNLGMVPIYLQEKSGYVDLHIQAMCGNGYCEVGEDKIKCPQDCFFGDKVRFRTSSLTYGSGSFVAFSYNECSTPLVTYKIKTASCWKVLSETCPSRSGYTLIMDQSWNIPGAPLGSSGQVGCLYKYDNDRTDITLAWKTVSSGGVCGITGQWQSITFDSELSSQNEMSNGWISQDWSMETNCQ